MQNIQKILVPYDFSEIGKTALKQAILLSQQYGATLLLLHIVDHESQVKISKLFDPKKDLRTELKNKIQQEVETLFSSSPSQKVPFEILVTIGKPALEILLVSEKEKMDLIVMGSHGHTGFKRLRLGSVAEKVIQRAGVPVFIHRGEVKVPKKILMPLDFSDYGKEGFQVGLKWASDFNAEIHLLHVLNLTDLYNYQDLLNPLEPALQELLKQEAEKTLSHWAQEIKTPFHQEIKLGNTTLEIEVAIRDQDIDLVILSTHGRTGLKHFLMGSVAESVVRYSSCSVLSIRPAALVESSLKLFKDEEEFEEYVKNCDR